MAFVSALPVAPRLRGAALASPRSLRRRAWPLRAARLRAPLRAALLRAPSPSPSPPLDCTVARAVPPAAPASRVLTLFSTIVGVCVLIGSVLYKIPQVVRVIRRRSAAGISVLMYSLETIGTTFSAVYYARRRIPFSTYGEGVFIMVQNFVILILIVFFERLPRVPAFVLAVLYVVAVVFLYSPIVPMSITTFLQVCSIPILNLARLPQIVLNWRRKSTGELAPITLGLQLLGNCARIFTTIAQVRDPLMLTAIAVNTCFNTALFAQWMWYSRMLSKVAKTVPKREPHRV